MPTITAPAAARPAATIAEVVSRLDGVIARSRRDGSRLGFFACLYRSVTVRVAQGIDAGRFQDGPRMERLDVIFANRYLAALEAYQAGRRPTRSWVAAFDAAKGANLLILQHLLLGMNAHINLDLGIAAAQAAPGREIAGLHHDFQEISRLLGEMLDGVQDKIASVSPWMGILDRVGARTDEEICAFCMGGSRDLAWKWAQRFATTDRVRLPYEIDALDRVVSTMAIPIHTPGLLLRSALSAIRMREAKDVGRVLDALA
ncbi:DUF5995 family protein [Longimicrobium sp.]|uniref:DUF5995 family protein n=1 Tax=Longimicrobium sp. TaxID=2029185 RepID=UPI002E2F2B58|nr:DUF5995 family protein [Longimicrobium sp.]HEX6042568.1 DUF5995 family protein [Longimicrobium sp.]